VHRLDAGLEAHTGHDPVISAAFMLSPSTPRTLGT